MTHKGRCHCGAISYEVEGDFDEVLECNCSICTKKGYLLWFVPRQRLRLTTQSGLGTYTFNKHAIQHEFCPKCGCGTFGLAKSPAGDPMAAINVRCLEGVDVAKLKRKFFDGRSL
jgi:hypothetical protein